jgi:hypothetical protein
MKRRRDQRHPSSEAEERTFQFFYLFLRKCNEKKVCEAETQPIQKCNLISKRKFLPIPWYLSSYTHSFCFLFLRTSLMENTCNTRELRAVKTGKETWLTEPEGTAIPLHFHPLWNLGVILSASVSSTISVKS